MTKKNLLLAVTAVVAGLLATGSHAWARGDARCCPPPPHQTTLCVAPPCSCCNTAVNVCVPGCCTAPPQVCWKKGLLGRQVGTYTWCDCGHQVKVVVNRRGEVKVRG